MISYRLLTRLNRSGWQDKFGVFEMKGKFVRLFLVLAVSLAIPVSSSFVGYYTVASADFLSSNLGFEAFDQEYLAAANQSELKIFDSSNFFEPVQLEIFPIGLVPHLSPPISPLNQRTSVLRC
jgi:hypothetical protein